MLYYFELTDYPRINRKYSVTRNTVWQITEQEHLLIFITEGHCQFTIGNETKIVEAGDIVYIPANQSYTRRSVDNTLCTMTYIHFTTLDQVSEESLSNLSRHIEGQKKHLDEVILRGDTTEIASRAVYVYLQTFFFAPDSEIVKESLDDLNSHSSKEHLMCPLQLSAILCNLLAHLSLMTINDITTNTKPPAAPEIPPKLRHAIAYITMHYSEPITLEDLSNHCCISKQQLIRYFNNAFHTTPLNYITNFKLSRAKELLFYHPDVSIKEIAAELGFDNQHYFSRVFTKKNGETPSQYRDRTLNYKNPELGMHQIK